MKNDLRNLKSESSIEILEKFNKLMERFVKTKDFGCNSFVSSKDVYVLLETVYDLVKMIVKEKVNGRLKGEDMLQLFLKSQ